MEKRGHGSLISCPALLSTNGLLKAGSRENCRSTPKLLAATDPYQPTSSIDRVETSKQQATALKPGCLDSMQIDIYPF